MLYILNCFLSGSIFVIETGSPNNSKYDLIDKRKVYEKSGVKEYRMVNPQTMVANRFYLLEGKQYSFAPSKGELLSKLLKHISASAFHKIKKPGSFKFFRAFIIAVEEGFEPPRSG